MFDGDSEGNEVAQIVKHWGGCREIFGGANDFSLRCEYMNHFKLEALISVSVYISTPSFFQHARTHMREQMCACTQTVTPHSLTFFHSLIHQQKARGIVSWKVLLLGKLQF